VSPITDSGLALRQDPDFEDLGSYARPTIAFASGTSHIHAMPYHRFKVGQVVVSPTGGPGALIPRGQHVIVRLLPIFGREPQYRIRSSFDGHDRIVLESQIKLAEWQPPVVKPAPRSESRGR
jgi:hypothetical protein